MADYAITADVGTGLIKTVAAVLDAAVGGLSLVLATPFADLPAGSELRMRVTLPGLERFETVGTIRHTQGRVGGRCGVHLNHLTPEQQTALSKTVSELLERGGAV